MGEENKSARGAEIVKALEDDESGVRLTCGSRWMIYCEGWVVYERRPYARHTMTIIYTQNEAEAVRMLLGG